MRWKFFSLLFLIIPHTSFASINLNNANLDDLKSIGLTKRQAQNLLLHKKKYGDLFSIYELQIVPGFDKEIIEKIAPNVIVEEFWPEDNVSLFHGRKIIRKKKNWHLLFRYGRTLEISKGYRNGTFVGSPDDFLTRINFEQQGYKFSLSFKKNMLNGFILDMLEDTFCWKKNLFSTSSSSEIIKLAVDKV